MTDLSGMIIYYERLKYYLNHKKELKRETDNTLGFCWNGKGQRKLILMGEEMRKLYWNIAPKLLQKEEEKFNWNSEYGRRYYNEDGNIYYEYIQCYTLDNEDNTEWDSETKHTMYGRNSSRYKVERNSSRYRNKGNPEVKSDQ